MECSNLQNKNNRILLFDNRFCKNYDTHRSEIKLISYIKMRIINKSLLVMIYRILRQYLCKTFVWIKFSLKISDIVDIFSI